MFLNSRNCAAPKYLIHLFEEERHIKDFCQKGMLYMSRINTFRSKGTSFRNDPRDGILIENCELWCNVPPPGEQITALSGPISKIPIDYICVPGFIYCFYEMPAECLLIQDGKLFIQDSSEHYPDFLKFLQKYREDMGGAYIAVLDEALFRARLNERLHINALPPSKCSFMPVIYDEHASAAPLTSWFNKYQFFKESNDFSYQHEIRLFIAGSPDDPSNHLEKYLGNLHDCIVFAGKYGE